MKLGSAVEQSEQAKNLLTLFYKTRPDQKN
jgi:hypothetical protein